MQRERITPLVTVRLATLIQVEMVEMAEQVVLLQVQAAPMAVIIPRVHPRHGTVEMAVKAGTEQAAEYCCTVLILVV